MTVEVVVAKFNEDILWTKKLKYSVTIYNKNESENHLFERNLLNYGKDAHTHLHHIVTNWYNLADYTIFLQGNPFEHDCETCVEFINDCDFTKPFYPIGPTYIRDNDGCIKQAMDYCEKMGIEYKLPFMFIGGMQCIVKKEQIKKRSLDFYVKLMESIAKNISTSSFSGGEHGNDPQIWALEYSWPTIFGVNEMLTHKLHNC
jgi:hypothetical protein